MSDLCVIPFPKLPPFASLKHRVVLTRVNTLKELAVIYSWCCANCTEWNLQVLSGLELPTSIAFAFNDELEALMFKLTWAY
jgi:hypothetical protein